MLEVAESTVWAPVLCFGNVCVVLPLVSRDDGGWLGPSPLDPEPGGILVEPLRGSEDVSEALSPDFDEVSNDASEVGINA